MTVGDVTIAPHNIWVLVKVKKDISIDPNNTEGAKREKEIAEIILHYKSLGSGTINAVKNYGTENEENVGTPHTAQVTIDGINYEIKFNETVTKNIFVKVDLTTEIKDEKKKEELKTTIQNTIVDYINSLEIGQDVLMSRVVSVINSKNTYTDFGFDVTDIKIGAENPIETTMVSVYPYEQAKTTIDNVTITIDGK